MKACGKTLKCHVPVELGVPGLIHVPHAALANESGQIVAPYAFQPHVITPETEKRIAAPAARA